MHSARGAVTLPSPNAAVGSLLPPPSSSALAVRHGGNGLTDPHDQAPIACDRDWDLVARVCSAHSAHVELRPWLSHPKLSV